LANFCKVTDSAEACAGSREPEASELDDEAGIDRMVGAEPHPASTDAHTNSSDVVITVAQGSLCRAAPNDKDNARCGLYIEAIKK